MDAVLDALRSEEPELPCVDEEIRRLIALAREVHRAAEVMRRMADNARAGDVTRKAETMALAAERERILYQELRAFGLAARGVIGNAA